MPYRSWALHEFARRKATRLSTGQQRQNLAGRNHISRAAASPTSSLVGARLGRQIDWLARSRAALSTRTINRLRAAGPSTWPPPDLPADNRFLAVSQINLISIPLAGHRLSARCRHYSQENAHPHPALFYPRDLLPVSLVAAEILFCHLVD